MTARAAVIALVVLTALAATAAGARSAEPPAFSLAARAARFPALRAATADFAQEREVSLVDEVLRAEGTLALAAPASFRLDLATPEPMALIAAGPTMTVADARGKTLPLPPEVAGLGRLRPHPHRSAARRPPAAGLQRSVARCRHGRADAGVRKPRARSPRSRCASRRTARFPRRSRCASAAAIARPFACAASPSIPHSTRRGSRRPAAKGS